MNHSIWILIRTLVVMLIAINVYPQNCGLQVAFDENVRYTQTVYVSPSGSNSNNGESEESPLRSLQTALERAVPGAKIILMPGNHSPGVHVSNVQGTADAPILITSDGNPDDVIFSGGSTCIQLSDPAYLILENFTVTGASGNGLNIDDGGSYDTPAHHVIVRNVHVRDIGPTGNHDGIKLSGLDSFRIENCTVQRPGSGGSAVDMVGCHDGIIAQNTFLDVGSSGVQAKGGTANITVYANRFERVEQRAVNMGGSTGLQFFRPIDAPYEASNITVIANVFVDVMTPVAFTGCQYGLFAHNTVIKPRHWIARILQESTQERFVQSSNNVYANNICVIDNQVSTLVNIGGNTLPDTFRFFNNLIYKEGGGNINLNQLPGTVEGTITREQPLFADDESYQIQKESPAVGHGKALNEAVRGLDITLPILGDRIGHCWSDMPDIGAFKFVEVTGVY